MGTVLRFLQESKKASIDWKELDEIHIVLGNEAGDLDSVMSAIVYAHFLYSTTMQTQDKRIAFLPVLNFDQENIELRLEHKCLLEEAGIYPVEELIYRSQLNFEEMVEYFENSGKSLYTYLVDHHILSRKDEALEKTVCRIFDHRPLDAYYGWTDHNLKMRIESVASCSTLIADEIFKDGRYEIERSLAYLLYCTIVYDMKGHNKSGSLDEEIKNKLLLKLSRDMNQEEIYNRLDLLHCDCHHLTPLQILKRDLKFRNGILFPRLTILAEDFIKLDGACRDLSTLCQVYGSDLAVLICSTPKLKGHRTDIGVFHSDRASAEFKEKFKSAMRRFNFAEFGTHHENFTVFRFLEGRIGRKKMLPLVLGIYDEIMSGMSINKGL